MTLDIGTRLGGYEVTGSLGAGGMGEVYRARDTKLNRDVAIKVLPALFAADPERVKRFEREAQALASLNHPNIAQIYGVIEIPRRAVAQGFSPARDTSSPDPSTGSSSPRGSSRGEGLHDDESLALVMEFVDGEDLAQRLERGPIPLDEALPIARQIADALDAAHEHGIVHRDLKPANIKLKADATVKVLDFGLAKSVGALKAGGTLPTVTSADTAAGTFLGTVAYMSPEQARGKAIDKRTDVWAFGCVLFELLTGRRTFAGATVSDTIVAVLEREPDWRLLPSSVPPRIVWLLKRCLAKDPNSRLHDIADARIEIDEAISRASDPLLARPAARGLKRTERLWWTAAAASLLVLLIVLSLVRARSGDVSADASRVYTTSIILPEGVRLAGTNPAGRFSLSPDGRILAVSAADSTGKSMLWVRPLESRTAQPLAGTDGAAFPFWSPDSKTIAFLAQGGLKKIDASGGDVVTLCDAPFNSPGTWGRDGTILFTPKGEAPIFRVPASGGTPVQVTTLDATNGEVQHSSPFFLPDGRHFLYLVVGSRKGGMTDARGVFLSALDSRGPGSMLLADASNAKYANGHLVFVRNGTLLAQPFDPDRLTLSGEAKPLVEQVQVSNSMTTGVPGSFSVSTTALTYQTSPVVRSQLVWYSRSGAVLGRVGDADDYVDVALSPDGSRVAVSLMDPPLGTRDIWILEAGRGVRERLTFDPGDDFGPNWSRPDPGKIVFSSRRAGGGIDLYEKPANGEGNEKLLFTDEFGKFNATFSPDGRYLAYVAGGGIISRSDIWVLPLIGDRKPFPFIETRFVETHPQFSPDGRWLAYTSNESGRFEVYVTSFPGKTARWRVSTAGGGWPRWNPNGKELFYLAANSDLIAVPLRTNGGSIEIGSEQKLFAAHPRPWSRLDANLYDVSGDGQRFLVDTFVDEPTSGILTLIVNWTTALR